MCCSCRRTRRCAPMRRDVSIGRVFFGGINVYLQEKVPLFRHTPWWFDRLLDNPALLERLSRRAASVDPTQLGGMTVSMLRGEAGNQRKEVEKLVHWLLDGCEARHRASFELDADRHGANDSRAWRAAGRVPASGEDLFLEKLPPPFYEEARGSFARASGGCRRVCRAESGTMPISWRTILAVDREQDSCDSARFESRGHAVRNPRQSRGLPSVVMHGTTEPARR